MKNLSVLVLVLVIAAVLTVYLFSFQVRETEVALVTRFGEPIRTLEEPGIYRKWPEPINVVYKFDSRSRLYERVLDETTTLGGEPIIVASYVVWKIGDPGVFLESVRDVAGAEKQLKTLLGNTQNTVIGEHSFSDFVNSDPSKIKFEEIEREMHESLKDHAMKEYGIEIRSVGIKQLKISEKATEAVFARMSADRDRKTKAILAEGIAEATRISTDAERKRTELLAIVESQAKSIRGSGDAEAAEYYKELEADPELAMFLRDLEALKKILKNKTTIVLGADTKPIELLKGIPDIKPKN